MRLLPRSLAGQMAVLIGAALLLAQLVSFAILVVERQQFTRAQIDAPAITRFTSTAADAVQAAPDFQALVLGDASHRGAQYGFARAPLVGSANRRSASCSADSSVLRRSTVNVADAGTTLTRSGCTRKRPTVPTW